MDAETRLEPKQRKRLEWWIGRLKGDAFAGDQIPKDRIPDGLATRNGLKPPLTNAWRFELPLAYRGVYTVQSSLERDVRVIILEVLSHKEYDRLLGYG
ncbi:MAG TPA: hypothetical protein VI893_07205 [Thermoplasmata archaeon]|nr:hypothetical protein [Thermoplasmata archaeon]